MPWIECIVNIVIYAGLGVLALWLLDKYIEIGKHEWEAECREIMREDKRKENAEWYVKTRTEDVRSDLMRAWEGLDV